jgi:dephospho-CoA kinase
MIIGITGYNGAGKSTVAKIIASAGGFHHLSAREYLSAQLHICGREATRANMRELGNKIRASEGSTALFQRMMDFSKNHSDVVIESVRCPGEIDVLIDSGGCLIGVDAQVEKRYDRAVLRGSSTDKISLEQFVSEEELEATSVDPCEQNIKACMEKALFVIDNNFPSQEKLEEHVKRVLRINNII